MIRRKALIFICAVGSFALSPESYAQSSTQAPLYSHTQEFSKTILDATVETSERASSLARQGNFYEAAREYEKLLGQWTDTPDFLLTYPVLMALGGAHLEAAINRVKYAAAPQLKDRPNVLETNMDAVNEHISQVYTKVGNAGNRAGGSGISGPDRTRFICEASAKLNAAVAVHGIANSNAREIDQGIAGYEKIKTCYPDADRVIGNLRGISRNVGGSIRGSDAIAANVSLLIEAIVPHGSLIGSFIDVGYKFYKESRPPVPDLPR